MGFGVNLPKNKPMIQEAKSMMNDGGAGNLGYFEQGEGESKEKSKNESIFSQESDTFTNSADESSLNEEFSIAKLIAEIILTIKNWLNKIFNLK